MSSSLGMIIPKMEVSWVIGVPANHTNFNGMFHDKDHPVGDTPFFLETSINMENMFLTISNNNFSTSFKCDQVHVPNHEHVQWELWPVLGDYVQWAFFRGKKTTGRSPAPSAEACNHRIRHSFRDIRGAFHLVLAVNVATSTWNRFGAGCFKSLARFAHQRNPMHNWDLWVAHCLSNC